MSLRIFLTLLASVDCICIIAALALRQRHRQAGLREFNPVRWLKLTEGGAQVGYWRVTLPGYHLTWSKEMFRLHGMPPGKTPDFAEAVAAYHSEDRAAVILQFQQAIASGGGFEIPLRLLCENGSLRHLRSHGAVETGRAGEVVSVFGILIDTTAQKQAEEEIQQLRAENESLRQQLEELATQDRLTGLANRRQLDAVLRKEFQRALREANSLGLIMIDIDHFKRYNELYGPLEGDRCLQQIARITARAVQRPGDLAARFDGEELILLLPNTDEIGAGVVADRIVADIRSLALEHKGNTGDVVTVSAGVGAIVPFRGDDPRRLLEQADIALRRAKRTGRNSVCFYSCENVRNITARVWPNSEAKPPRLIPPD